MKARPVVPPHDQIEHSSPWRRDCRDSRFSSVQVRYLTSATNFGGTQWARLSTSGEPKRLLRGGATSRG